MSGLDIAIVHHLPPAGGAPRVIAEYVGRRPQHRFSVYTRMPQPAPGEALVSLPQHVPVHRFPVPEPSTTTGRMLEMARLPNHGRALASIVDRAGHDVVFAHASVITQNHEILPHLRTPSLAYAPEAMRHAYEDIPAMGAPRGLRQRLADRGLNPYERLRRRVDRRAINAATQVVTHSAYTAGVLRRVYGVDAAVVPLGVDAEGFAGPETGPRERRVLSVGAFHPLKGHQFVIEALAAIPAGKRPPLTIVGDRGDIAGQLRMMAAECGVELDLLQGIPFTELVRQYHAVGVLACGQLREPFGLITLEGMAAGVPVVAVAEGGFLETVRHGETGLLAPREPAAFAAALVRVLDDDDLAAGLRGAGLAETREHWSWERTAAGYDALLWEITDGRRR